MANSLATLMRSLPAAKAAALNGPTTHAPQADIADLTRRMAQGDEDSFREFHERYYERLYRLTLVLTCGCETDARDTLQETLFRVARYVRVFEEEEIFWCWLSALARSAVRDAGRKRRRYLALIQNYVRQWLPLQAGPQQDADQQLELMLLRCLSELELEDRLLVEGKYLHDMSVRDLAAKTGLSEKAVESRLLRLRRQLRERLLRKLKEYDHEPS